MISQSEDLSLSNKTSSTTGHSPESSILTASKPTGHRDLQDDHNFRICWLDKYKNRFGMGWGRGSYAKAQGYLSVVDPDHGGGGGLLDIFLGGEVRGASSYPDLI